MKDKIGLFFALMIGLTILAPSIVLAQAPASITGDGIGLGVIDGVYPFASFGYSVFLPANSGNTYQNIGIYNVTSSSGTYSYTPTGPNTATVSLSDGVGGFETTTVTFASTNQGTYHDTDTSFPGAYQDGDFVYFSGQAPGSIVGFHIYGTVSDGSSPFAYTGHFTFIAASSGNTYQIIGDGVNVANSTGTYSYSLANRSTGQVQMSDSLAGSSTVYVGFDDPQDCAWAAKSTSGGYQIGSCVILDVTPPTCAITAPTPGQRWSNSVFTVKGTASDNVQVSAVYYQIFGQGWNLATSSNGWTNWSGNINLQVPGTNQVQAYSVDSSGNQSAIVSQNIDYVVPPLPPYFSIVRQGTNMVFNWPTNAPGFRLEFATNLPATNWKTNPASPAIVNGQYSATNPISGPAKFYRLMHP